MRGAPGGNLPSIDDDPEATQELRLEQVQKAKRERDAAEHTPVPDEADVHDARAEKAAYLAQKLAERERTEREG